MSEDVVMDESEDEIYEDELEEVDFGNVKQNIEDVESSSEGENAALEAEKMDLEETKKSPMFVHQGPIYSVDIAVDKNNRVLGLSGGGDETSFLWDITNNVQLARIKEHSDSIIGVEFNPDKSRFATASYDATIRIYDTETQNRLLILQGPSSEIEWFRWHPTGNVILAGSADTTTWIWDVSSGKCVSVMAGHEQAVSCGMFTRNGKRVVTGSLDGSVRLWDPKSSVCICAFTGNNWHEAGVTSLTQHPEEPLIAAGGQDGSVRLARLDVQKTICSLQHGKELDATEETDTYCSIESIQFCKASHGRNLLASAGTDGAIKVWDWVRQTLRHQLNHDSAVVKLEFLGDSFHLLSCSRDTTIRLWDARSGEELNKLAYHEDMVLDFKILAAPTIEGVLVISAGDDKACYVEKLLSDVNHGEGVK